MIPQTLDATSTCAKKMVVGTARSAVQCICELQTISASRAILATIFLELHASRTHVKLVLAKRAHNARTRLHAQRATSASRATKGISLSSRNAKRAKLEDTRSARIIKGAPARNARTIVAMASTGRAVAAPRQGVARSAQGSPGTATGQAPGVSRTSVPGAAIGVRATGTTAGSGVAALAGRRAGCSSTRMRITVVDQSNMERRLPGAWGSMQQMVSTIRCLPL